MSAIEASTRMVSASRVKVTSSPEPDATRSPSVSSAVRPWAWISTSMPLRSSQRCRSASSAFASSTMLGTFEPKAAASLRIGSASSDAEQAERRRTSASEDDQHREPARHAAALEEGHERVEQQRDQRRDDEQERDRARRAQQRPGAEDREREDDELDPARDDDRRHGRRRVGRSPARWAPAASGGAGGSPGRGSGGGSATPPAPGRSCSSCIASSMRRAAKVDYRGPP